MRDFGNGAIVLGNAINRDHPLNRGLVSFWFGSTTNKGNRLLDATAVNHATFNASPTWGSGLARFSGVTFNGSSQYLSTPARRISGLASDDASLFVVVKYTATTTGRYILSLGNTADNDPIFAIHTGTVDGTKAGCHWRNDLAVQTQIIGTTNVNDGRWHVICAMRRSSNLYLFVDGKQQASGGTLSGTITHNTLSLAALSRASVSLYWAGTISSAAVVARSYTDGEVDQLHHEAMSGYPTMLNRLSPLRTFYFGTGGAAAAVRDMSQLHLGSVSFSHRNILQRGSIGVNS